MFLLNKNNPSVVKLVGLLQDQDIKVRLTAYYAMAEYIVPSVLKGYEIGQLADKVSEIKQTISTLLHQLNEIAIIDLSLLERIFSNVLEYKLSTITYVRAYNTRLIEVECFQDVLGITKYYPADDIHTINTHFDTFKLAVGYTVLFLKDFDKNNTASEA